MAIINGMYIQTIDEDMDREVDSTSHPVEKGIDLTDMVHNKPLVLSISGRIVDYDNVKASTVISKLNAWRASGSLVDFSGRNVVKGFQIVSFNTGHPNTVWGGAEFDMTLKEVRIAKSSYMAKKPVITPPKKNEAKKNPVLKVGATVVFKGGSVYVSSDAKKAAATRGRSTCKITIITTASWAKHKYHLISKDGKKVYGWVDKDKIEGAATPAANGQTNGGTQKVKNK